MGHRTPIAKLEVKVDSTWQEGTRQSYNYWQVGSGNIGMPPYDVRVTDMNGAVVEAMLELTSGDQPSGQQFATCQ